MKHQLAIIGLGYVGLPLAAAFGKRYDVVGFDIDTQRVAELIQSDWAAVGVTANIVRE